MIKNMEYKYVSMLRDAHDSSAENYTQLTFNPRRHLIEYCLYEKLKKENYEQATYITELFENWLTGRAQVASLKEALENTCMHLDNCLVRVKAPDPWMLKDAKEALAKLEQD